MDRRIIETGEWFDASKAIVFDEGTDWNGNNHISLATGSQWNHERLYYTRSNRWVLNSWSQWQGSTESYDLVTDDIAAAWLVRNGRADELSELPSSKQVVVNQLIGTLEV